MANFIMRRNNVRIASGDDRLYPQMVLNGVVTLDDVAQKISDGTTFTPGDIKGVVAALSHEIAVAAAEGNSVRIEGIGTFRARLAVKDDEKIECAGDDTKRNAQSVFVDGIYFKASGELVLQTNSHAHLKRIRQVADKSKIVLPPAERQTALRQYLTKNHYIGCAAYAALTGLSRSAATKELRELLHAQNSFLSAEGRGSHRVYVLKN